MKRYSSRAAQADQLAERVAGQLRDLVKERGNAVLVVAGGSTPKLFLNSLSTKDVDWSKIIVIPSDERWVDSTHPRSNDRFIRENLLTNKAAAAKLVSLYQAVAHAEEALADIEARLGEFDSQPAVCVLGMGEDAHFASLFPGADNLATALDPTSQKNVIIIRAPGAGETRISLTLAKLLKSANIHLLIAGNQKLATLNEANLAGDTTKMPIRAILNNESVEIHFAE